MAIGLLLVIALLNGCGAANLSLSGFESSKAAYMRCLEQNPDEPSKCESFRQAYEADVRAMRETSRGLTRGGLFPADR
jgi:hypothetical protein